LQLTATQGLRCSLDAAANKPPNDELKKLISVSLRPDDPFAKRLLSTPVTTNNLLLKVTVPKRTGRKRKRGSTGPFLTDDQIRLASGGSSVSKTSAHVSAAEIYRSLQDNAARYEVVPTGVVNETHRFRAMPDLQYAASHNDTMVGIRDHLLPMRCMFRLMHARDGS
jgi:general transcription factor 3C polypeptide 5 (transcription factor C subunit 1)